MSNQTSSVKAINKSTLKATTTTKTPTATTSGKQPSAQGNNPSTLKKLSEKRQESEAPLRKEYTLDVDTYVDFYTRRYYRDIALTCGLVPTWLCIPCLYDNLVDAASAVRVGVSDRHVVYSKSPHDACCRIGLCHQPSSSRLIAIDHISDVEVIEPGGDCCPPNALYVVKLCTASGVTRGCLLTISGLSKKDAFGFRDAVLQRRAKYVQSKTIQRY